MFESGPSSLMAHRGPSSRSKIIAVSSSIPASSKARCRARAPPSILKRNLSFWRPMSWTWPWLSLRRTTPKPNGDASVQAT